MKKIVLAGGSGQMGTCIKDHFKDKVDEIIVLSRAREHTDGNVKTVRWDGKTLGDWYKYLDGADVVINLAGKSVNCRYNEKNKKEIFDSRTNSIDVLSAAIKKCKVAPNLWIQSASATIYRHAEDRPMTESDGEQGEGFSVEVCKKWESTFEEKTKGMDQTRKIILRTSLVLGKDLGVFPRLKNLVKFGLGGRQGNGNQWVSWIHEKDVAAMVEWIIKNDSINGPINCTSPEPLKNNAFMKIIRNQYHMPVGLPAPVWILELGAMIIGTETELILKSRWVLPEKILKSGYRFHYPSLDVAVKNILNE
jgi:uncharacterized protein (TIGR01777 family)